MEIPLYINNKVNNPIESKIPKSIIQTFKSNIIDKAVYDNTMSILALNPDYNYYFITDDIGIQLIKQYFNNDILNAYNKLNIGAAKGDFLRYIAMYIYGGVYLDLDSGMDLVLSSYIDPQVEHVFFTDGGFNAIQWVFMVSPKHPIILTIINEMVKRISNKEPNIFLATGPTLFTDCIFNYINKTFIYDTRTNVSNINRDNCFKTNKNFYEPKQL